VCCDVLSVCLSVQCRVGRFKSRFEPSSVLWAFHTIQPSSFYFAFTLLSGLLLLLLSIRYFRSIGTEIYS